MFHVTCGFFFFLLAKSRNLIFTLFLLLNTSLPSVFIRKGDMKAIRMGYIWHKPNYLKKIKTLFEEKEVSLCKGPICQRSSPVNRTLQSPKGPVGGEDWLHHNASRFSLLRPEVATGISGDPSAQLLLVIIFENICPPIV